MKRPLLLAVGLVVAGAACGGKNKPAPAPAPQANANADSAAAAKARQDSIAAAEARAREDSERLARQRSADSLAALGHTTEAVRSMLGTMIHFDFDKSNIRSGDASILDQKIQILQANPNARIEIDGNCDERGSTEYNLALGNRRANSAKQYLVTHGIEAGRIDTKSYGEERPLDPAHNEQAWAQNRRDEFQIIAGGDELKQP